jgi:hypothetical protein
VRCDVRAAGDYVAGEVRRTGIPGLAIGVVDGDRVGLDVPVRRYLREFRMADAAAERIHRPPAAAAPAAGVDVSAPAPAG